MTRIASLLVLAALWIGIVLAGNSEADNTARTYLVVLGIAQDGGVPQAGTKSTPEWRPEGFRRLVTSLALVDEAGGKRYLFEATPDLREQLTRLDQLAPDPRRPGLDGVFLTHAHMGHYTGLMFLGHESMGARDVPVYAMPRMADFLRTSGPWSQLVKYGATCRDSPIPGFARRSSAWRRCPPRSGPRCA